MSRLPELEAGHQERKGKTLPEERTERKSSQESQDVLDRVDADVKRTLGSFNWLRNNLTCSLSSVLPLWEPRKQTRPSARRRSATSAQLRYSQSARWLGSLLVSPSSSFLRQNQQNMEVFLTPALSFFGDGCLQKLEQKCVCIKKSSACKCDSLTVGRFFTDGQEFNPENF